MSTVDACPLDCGSVATIVSLLADVGRLGARYITCAHCSKFILSNSKSVRPFSVSDENLARLQVLVAEIGIHGLPMPWLMGHSQQHVPVAPADVEIDLPSYAPTTVDELLSKWPLTIQDRLDRALRNLQRCSPTLGIRIDLQLGEGPNQCPTLMATSSEEARFVIEALRSKSWVTCAQDFGGAQLQISPEGWAHLAELDAGGRSSRRNPGFVAMWFGDNDGQESVGLMSSVFDAMKRAIEGAGYRADRADLALHNDFIMDKVLGMIRAAPFVVADFTGNRGGVYLEAGFARGLGIPVIHTCRTTDFEQAHFDIKQINTIVWDEPDALAEKLHHRILGTLGRGPFETQVAARAAT
ncbi:MAG: hypothetical protein U1D55_06680 [Phycisphaerae bacterium]